MLVRVGITVLRKGHPMADRLGWLSLWVDGDVSDEEPHAVKVSRQCMAFQDGSPVDGVNLDPGEVSWVEEDMVAKAKRLRGGDGA